MDVLLHIVEGTVAKSKKGGPIDLSSGPKPCPAAEKGEFAVLPVLLATINGISHVRIYLDKDIRGLDARNKAFKNLQEVKKRFSNGIALLDPVKNMGITDDEFYKLLRVGTILLLLLSNALISSCH